MPNRNYQAGAAFERRRKAHYESEGYVVVKAGGSKGPFDLVCLPSPAMRRDSSTLAVQCKRVTTIGAAERLQRKWLSTNRLVYSTEVLDIYIKDIREVMSVWR